MAPHTTTTDSPLPAAQAPLPAARAGLLDELLDAEVAFDAAIPGGFSSHLAMELVALDRFGAPPERLRAAFDDHAQRWAQPRRHPEVVADLLAETRWNGIGATVRERGARLVHSPASEWFHSAIRLAYALDADHPGQVASSLASWEERRADLPVPLPSPGTRPVAEAFAAVGRSVGAEAAAGAWPVDVTALDGFAAGVDGVVAGEAALDQLAAVALAAYVAGDDFGTLHMVTGTQALRAVGRHLAPADADVLAARAVQAVAAAWLASGAPALPGADALDELRGRDHPGWDAIAAAAVATPDVHATKLAYTCRLELARTGDPLYHHVAARGLGLA